jgi:hypothetical protein
MLLKTGLNNILLPILFWLNNIVNNQEQYGQQNIFRPVFINIVTGWAFFLLCSGENSWITLHNL